ncbi:multidrug transporter [Herbiconiux sp. A18JL235]|uniref:Multidrug transporter n=1 Tax=Herbiconiux sp. A18JL235 TaxID=3152363 RepID=A0AB39BEA5_9MICO
MSDEDFEAKRHDQLTSAPNATEEDAAPRIDVSETADGHKRIDVRDDAVVRPGGDPEIIDPEAAAEAAAD